MRLDLYLAESGLADSRTVAKRLIEAGSVTVNEKSVTKPSFDVSGDEKISVDTSGIKFVSRGGFKLEGALDGFSVSPMGRTALDVGASSGGFTDCLLQRGAVHVIAVDSGSGQMVDSLRRDSRVTVLENYNARYMSPSDFGTTPDLAVMDVSFISAKLIIPSVYSVLSSDSDFICLIKPQFEVGRSGIGKGGIVKDKKLRRNAVDGVVDFAVTCGFKLCGVIESPILGGDGNTEYLAHFRKESVSGEKGNNSSEQN